jgi:hypothetical protein
VVRSYLTAWIPSGRPTYEEVFWARAGGLLLPFLLLGSLVFGYPSIAWLAVGFAGYLCIPGNDRTAAERQNDDADLSLPGAIGVTIVFVVGIVVLSTPTVENQFAAAKSVAPTVVTSVTDALGSIDFGALVIGGIYGVFAKTAYRWHTADEVRPPN